MPEVQYIGDSDFTLQPSPTYFSEGQGWSTTAIYRGSTVKLNQFLSEIFVIGVTFGGITSLGIMPDGPYSEVSVTFAQSPFNPVPNPDPIATVRTLSSGYQEVEIFNHPLIQHGFFPPGSNIFLVGLNEMTVQDLSDFKQELALQLEDPTRARFESNTMQSLILVLRERETTGIQIPNYTLRKVETVYSKTQLKASHTNVGKIHNFQDLVIAEPTLPAAILVDPLNMAQLQVNEKSLNWLKMAPSVDQVSGGRYQIVQEYLGVAHFDPYLYKTVGPFNEVAYNQKKYAI